MERLIREETLRAARDYAREVFSGDFSGHDLAHTLRVCRMAAYIAGREGADEGLVRLAALLHDVDDAKLSPETHRDQGRAAAFLRAQGLAEDVVASVLESIASVSFAGSGGRVPATLEGKCVQDADRLDALGAVGVARAFAYGGSHHRAMHDPAIPPRAEMTEAEYRDRPSTTVNHFYEKLFKLKDLMNTDTARAVAEKREAFMRAFLAEFLAEWDGAAGITGKEAPL